MYTLFTREEQECSEWVRVLTLVLMMNRLCLDTADINPFDFEQYLNEKRELISSAYVEKQKANHER